MQRSEIEAVVISSIFETTFETVTPTDEIVKQGIIDSITVVDLSVKLEEELGIKIPFVDLNEQHFGTVNLIVNYLEQKLN